MRLCSDFISDVTQTTAAVDKEVARNAENAQRSAEYERMTSTPRARGFFCRGNRRHWSSTTAFQYNGRG
jgi:hypothetical protein